MAALERAYENQRMVGKFPGCVLQVQVKANAVDVNVHPAKTEVKFLFERKVFDGVYYAVLSALTAEQRHPEMSLTAPAKQEEASAQPEERLVLHSSGMDALLRPVAKKDLPAYTVSAARPTGFSPETTMLSTHSGANVDKSVENVEKLTRIIEPIPSTPFPDPPLSLEKRQECISVPVPEAKTEDAPIEAPSEREEAAVWRLVGEVFQTYLVVEQEDQVCFIDKHAAHERMHFDRMKQEDYQPMSQALLTPMVFTPSPEEGAVLAENLPLLAQFGFVCEEFGGDALVLRALPDYLDPGQAERVLGEIAETLLTGAGADPQAARDTLLHTMACKAAVKGGQKNSREELLVVVREVMAGRVKYCPHGRPVAITLTKEQLEREFKRS